jgi:hypothetical protein
MRRTGVYARTCQGVWALEFLSEIGEVRAEALDRLRKRSFLPRAGGNLQPLWDLVLYEVGLYPPRYPVPALCVERRG